ncbi:MAG: SDR family NAD(P)-dependent oxidoreductase [Bacteroidales bacterium]|jgi:NAD(P)-dependent dehydrogenase (short-subunit alcohol dehydrogenase family)|nr:SDR family NAD(P)-dependent oxidoreductase [Bacteroidales bacterium]
MAGIRHKKYDNPFIATVTGITDLFRKYEPAGTLKHSDRLEGKTVLVDGSSSGLGFAVATECARRGARVIMACRSGIPEKGEKIKQLTGNPKIHMLPVDFSDINSIRHLAVVIHNQFAPIDIYICNAGIVPKQSRKTSQGLEEMFMVNYFSKFIFVNLLFGNRLLNKRTKEQSNIEVRTKHNRNHESALNQPKPASCILYPASGIQHPVPRIIFIASESHRNPEKFEWDAFGKYQDYSIGKSVELYGYYKLLLTTFVKELSRRLNPDPEIRCPVFVLCPGPVNSNIAREAPGFFKPLLKLVFTIFFKSPVKAAIPVIYLAASPDVEGKPFDYLFLMNRKSIDEKAAAPENGKRLWELSEKLLQSIENA